MDYITIDFETANRNLTSACSIGIVGVTNNKIVFEEYYLINPQEEFCEYNINIHQITPKDVSESETFDLVWNKIKKYFVNTTVYAHNASFDIAVLKAIIEKYNLEIPKIRFGCTFKMATKLWKSEINNHKLNTLADFLEVEHQHHNALSDAKVCVEIITRGQRVMNVSDHNELYEILGLRYGMYDEKRYFSSMNKYVRDKKVKVIENEVLNDKVLYLSGKPNSMNRKQLIDKLISNGVYIDRNINRSLDYFLELGNCPKQKSQIVNTLISEGIPIKIITEEEILKLIK